MMDKPFGEFYTTKAVGMGIGLSVSRLSIQRRLGRIRAEPSQGAGSTFAFSVRARPGGKRT
jgi:C4-dicarboxylate-specific signal transduction histidine kinase